MMDTPTTNRLSFGQLCILTGAVPHRIRYLLTSRGIKPAETISGMHLYDAVALAELKAALDAAKVNPRCTHEAVC